MQRCPRTAGHGGVLEIPGDRQVHGSVAGEGVQQQRAQLVVEHRHRLDPDRHVADAPQHDGVVEVRRSGVLEPAPPLPGHRDLAADRQDGRAVGPSRRQGGGHVQHAGPADAERGPHPAGRARPAVGHVGGAALEGGHHRGDALGPRHRGHERVVHAPRHHEQLGGALGGQGPDEVLGAVHPPDPIRRPDRGSAPGGIRTGRRARGRPGVRRPAPRRAPARSRRRPGRPGRRCCRSVPRARSWRCRRATATAPGAIRA